MSLVNISLDTEKRTTVMTIDGVMVGAKEYSLSSYEYEGETIIGFSYTVEAQNDQGLMERRQFFLPSIEEAAVKAFPVDDQGLAVKSVYDNKKAQMDTVEFLGKRNKRLNVDPSRNPKNKGMKKTGN